MSRSNRGSIYRNTGNLHTEQNQSVPGLGLAAVDSKREHSLWPAAVFFGLFFLIALCLVFIIFLLEYFEARPLLLQIFRFPLKSPEGDSILRALNRWPSGWKYYYGVFGPTLFLNNGGFEMAALIVKTLMVELFRKSGSQTF